MAAQSRCLFLASIKWIVDDFNVLGGQSSRLKRQRPTKQQQSKQRIMKLQQSKRSTKKNSYYCRILITPCRLFDSSDKKVEPVAPHEQDGDILVDETSTSTLALHEDSDKESLIPEYSEYAQFTFAVFPY